MSRSDENPSKYYSKVLALKNLAEYQTDSIVSRTIVNKKAGTITFFAFYKGQVLSEHTAPYDALVQVMDGRVEITISGKAMRLKEGDMVLMPANAPHALRAISSFKMLLIMIKA